MQLNTKQKTNDNNIGKGKFKHTQKQTNRKMINKNLQENMNKQTNKQENKKNKQTDTNKDSTHASLTVHKTHATHATYIIPTTYPTTIWQIYNFNGGAGSSFMFRYHYFPPQSKIHIYKEAGFVHEKAQKSACGPKSTIGNVMYSRTLTLKLVVQSFETECGQ